MENAILIILVIIIGLCGIGTVWRYRGVIRSKFNCAPSEKENTDESVSNLTTTDVDLSSFVNRWVAVIAGRVIASAPTYEELASELEHFDSADRDAASVFRVNER